jgi:hypothetical protein
VAAAGAALIPSAGTASARSRPPSEPGAAGSQALPPEAPASPSGASSIPQLPLRDTYPHLPAIPIDEAAALDTVGKLQMRNVEQTQAKSGLNQQFTIGGKTRTAYAFLFGGAASAAPSGGPEALASLRQGRVQRSEPVSTIGTDQPLTLDDPEQYAIGWTTFPNVYETGSKSLPAWSSALTDADSATRQFWPTIARHGYGFNLIVPERVTRARARGLRRAFGSAWSRQVRAALAAGNLYVIDLTRFEALPAPQSVNGAPRFTPATVTLLTRNPRTKTLTPVAIIVSAANGSDRTTYTRATASDGAWLYALQAAKASATLFGVWLGHVYSWHLVTAAMQMTMRNTLPTDHPVYQLLAPQSNFVIGFDDVLFALWSQIAPPTSLSSKEDLFAVANAYADGRSYFDDDPKATIRQLGLRQRDFTARTPWDKYPVVQRFLGVWNLVEPYVSTFVSATYASDSAVAGDGDLQTWIATAGSSDPNVGGNIAGLPEMNSRAALSKVLTSLLYRVTVHGIARLVSTSSPVATFQANYPMCLQRTDIPSPRARISTTELLSYLPNTDTISAAVGFFFTFAFSAPYVPFIPLNGVGENLFFPGGIADKRNQALRELRRGLAAFIDDYQPDMPQRFQWPLNIET